MNMTFNGFCEGLYPNNQGGDTLFSLVRKLNELLPEMIEEIEEGGGGESDINNLKLYYDTTSQSLQLQGVEGKVISEISAAPFIKDGMLNAVENNETEHIITLTFNTDAGKMPITLNYDSLWEGMETSLKGYTDSQVSALSSQVVKGIRVGSGTSNEPISDGVVTLPVASGVGDGVMSSEMYENLNVGFVTVIGVQRSSDNLKLNYTVRTGIEGASQSNSVTLRAATSEGSGVMSSADKTKLDSIISTGDGTKFLADDFTYKTIQMPDLSTYATKSELSGYLPLNGGTMTGTLHMGTNAISGSKYNIIQAESNGNVNIGATAVKIALYSDRELQRKTNSSMYTIYDSGNFIAGTNYLAPNGVTIADINNLGNNWSSILTNSIGASGDILKLSGSTPIWTNLVISDISGLQNSLDGKVNIIGDSYKNNNACWGGTRPDGTQTCLAFIDTNGNNKFGNCYGGTYVRASSINSLQLEVGTPGNMDDSEFYTIYNSGNFKAGTNYVAPSTLNNYLPLSGGAMSGNITMNGANSNIYLRNSATITGYFGEDALPILYADSINNKTVIGTVGKPLQVRSNNPIVRTNSSNTEYTVYDSGNLDVSSFVTTSGNENLVFPQRAITVGKLDTDEYNYYRVARNNSYSYFTNSSTATVINYETYGSGGSVDATSKLEITTSDLTFNDNHVLTEADTFNTITYTTSASEDNLRAWNNYVNGYVTNLRIVDTALTSYIRVVNGVDIEDKKFDVYVIGGDPVRLVRAEYTLADNGSVTKSTVNYTLTLATA